MVTFVNLKSRLSPSTKFEVRRPSRSEITAHLVCQLSIQQFPSYSNHNVFTYPGLHFLFALGTTLGQSR